MAAHVIQPGDTASGIARKSGMTLEALAAMNPGLCDANNHWRVLYPGQVLQVQSSTAAATPTQPAAGSVPQAPPWMETALREQGVAEWSPGDNPRIVEYLASVGIRGGDETSWCAAFVNWSQRKSGFNGHNTGLAGRWINYGRAACVWMCGGAAAVERRRQRSRGLSACDGSHQRVAVERQQCEPRAHLCVFACEVGGRPAVPLAGVIG